MSVHVRGMRVQFRLLRKEETQFFLKRSRTLPLLSLSSFRYLLRFRSGCFAFENKRQQSK